VFICIHRWLKKLPKDRQKPYHRHQNQTKGETNMNQDLNIITESIIGCAYTVANTLGHGFIEKIYENALNHELSKNGLRVKQQYPIEGDV